MAIEKKGMMFVLSSPSGAGKTTLTKKIAENNRGFAISISHTTRKPRPNEIDGVDYHFVSKEKFEKLIKEKNFYEHDKIFDNYYGTSRSLVQSKLEKGKNVILEIDWQGAKEIRKTGTYEAKINLHAEIQAKIHIEVVEEDKQKS